MKSYNIYSSVYSSGDGWFIEIVNNWEKQVFESWLYYEGYGVKTYIFGMSYNDVSFDKFKILVLTQYQDYISAYVDEVMVND